MTTDVRALADELGKVVSEVRETQSALEKKYDGIDAEKVRKITEDIEKVSQAISDLNVKAEANKKLEERAANLERQLAAVTAAKGGVSVPAAEKSEQHKAFGRFLRSQEAVLEYAGMNKTVAEDVVKKSFSVVKDLDYTVKSLIVGSDPNGGFLVPTDFYGVVSARIFETSPIRAYATVITTANSEVEVALDDGEAAAGWVGEVATRPVTASPTVGKVTIPIHEVYANIGTSQKFLDDAGVDVEGWLQGHISSAFARQQNAAFVAGNSSNKPRGFLSFPNWTTPGQYQQEAIEQVSSGVNGGFTADAFKELLNYSLKQDYVVNSTWFMNRATWGEVTKLKDTSDRYLFEQISNFRDGDTLRLLGRPVVLAPEMPVPAINALAVAVGDFRRGYMIADRIGMRMMRDPFSQKPMVLFYATARVGGNVTNYEAIKIMKLAA